MGGRTFKLLAMASLGVLAACGTDGPITGANGPAIEPEPTAERATNPAIFGVAPFQGCSFDAAEDVDSTELGYLLREHCPIAPLTNEDSGRVHVRYSPPSSGSVITTNELRNAFGNRLSQLVWSDVRSASVILDVFLRTPGGGEKQIGVAPLSTYSFTEVGGIDIQSAREFRNAPVTPFYRILDGQTTIAVRTRIEFSDRRQGELVENLTTIVGAAADFGGHGWMVNAFTDKDTTDRLTRIQNLFLGGSYSIKESNTIEMGYGASEYQRASFLFNLNPAGGTLRSFGEIEISLQRDPSIYPNISVVNRRPNYEISSLDQYDRFLELQVADGKKLASFMESEAGVGSSIYSTFMRASQSIDQFNLACSQVWQKTGELGLSAGDRRAAFWSLVQQSENNSRADAWAAGSCLRTVEQSSRDFGFRIAWDSGRNFDTVVLSDERMRDFVNQRLIRALAQDPTSEYKAPLIEALFIPGRRVEVEAPSGALFPHAVTLQEQESLNSLLGALKGVNYQVGCFYRDGATPQRVNLLVRPGRGDNPLYRMSVDVLSFRFSGGGEQSNVSAIRLRPTTRADFTEMATRLPETPRCHTADTALPAAVQTADTPNAPAAPAAGRGNRPPG